MLLLVNILNPKFIPCLKVNLVTKSLFVAKGKKRESISPYELTDFII